MDTDRTAVVEARHGTGDEAATARNGHATGDRRSPTGQ